MVIKKLRKRRSLPIGSSSSKVRLRKVYLSRVVNFISLYELKMLRKGMKRLSLPIGSSSSKVRPRKTCLIGQGESEEHGREYIIYIFDLDSGVDKALVSTIQMDMKCFSSAAFSVIGSVLFVFEGFIRMFGEVNPDRRVTVFKYELPRMPSSEIFNIKLDRSMFKVTGKLNDSKAYPFATVLPGKKVLVFSTVINIERVWETHCDFEIFDVVEGVSHKLDKLCPNSSLVGRRDSFNITSHAIMDSVLVLQTEIGIFTLNLKAPYETKQWKSCTFAGAPNIPTHPSSSFAVIKKKICILPYYAFDIDESGLKENEDAFSRWYFKFPDISSIPDKGFVFGGATILKDYFSMEDEIGLCFMKLGVNTDTRHPRMVFDVYKLDLHGCKMGLAAIRKTKREGDMKRELILLPGATKVVSFDYVDKAAKFVTFRMRHFSYI